jgi:rod shape-determining protein MreC
MNWISSLFPRYSRNVQLILLILLSLLLIVNIKPVNTRVSQAALLIFYEPFSAIQTIIRDLYAVHEANEELNRLLVEASLKASQLEEAGRENERLRTILGFEPPSGYRLMPAQVIAVSGRPLPTAAVIGRGRHDSVYADQPVINQQGLIGRISDVMPDYATVQLLTDPANRVAVRISASREMGIARYSATQGMILDNFPIQGTINVGDSIISSGLGGVYPSGLIVGVVTRVSRPPEEPFSDVWIEPTVNFNSLEELFLLVPAQP